MNAAERTFGGYTLPPMGRIRHPEPVKLIIGLLSGDADLLARAKHLLTREFGPVDAESELWPFEETEFYKEEMGPGLSRRFLAFEKLIGPDRLAGVKVETNGIEARIAEDCAEAEISRPVNIDPGYVDLGKLVLATTKDRAHRIYVGSGIFAEATLQFVNGVWQEQPWTYPDYRRPEYQAFFTSVRNRLREQRAVTSAFGGGG